MILPASSLTKFSAVICGTGTLAQSRMVSGKLKQLNIPYQTIGAEGGRSYIFSYEDAQDVVAAAGSYKQEKGIERNLSFRDWQIILNNVLERKKVKLNTPLAALVKLDLRNDKSYQKFVDTFA